MPTITTVRFYQVLKNLRDNKPLFILCDQEGKAQSIRRLFRSIEISLLPIWTEQAIGKKLLSILTDFASDSVVIKKSSEDILNIILPEALKQKWTIVCNPKKDIDLVEGWDPILLISQTKSWHDWISNLETS